MGNPGRALIILGLLLIAVGAVINWGPKLPSWLGRLPGDISCKRENFSFYMPLTSSLIISALASLILWLIRK